MEGKKILKLCYKCSKICKILCNMFKNKFYIIKSKFKSGVTKLVAYPSEVTSVTNYIKPKNTVSYNESFT